MIPETIMDEDFEILDETRVSKTYKLSETIIQGYADGLEALQQGIYKELSTQMYEYPIYSFDYGIELESLVGKDITYVKLEMKRRIQECLLQDERIESVDNFAFVVTGDEILLTFEVESIYGKMTITKEVNV